MKNIAYMVTKYNVMSEELYHAKANFCTILYYTRDLLIYQMSSGCQIVITGVVWIICSETVKGKTKLKI